MRTSSAILPLPHVHLWSAKTKLHAICVRSLDWTTVHVSKPGVLHCAQLYGNLLCSAATTLMTNIKLIAVLKFCFHNTIYINLHNSNKPLVISVSLEPRSFLDECHVVTLHYTKTAKAKESQL